MPALLLLLYRVPQLCVDLCVCVCALSDGIRYGSAMERAAAIKAQSKLDEMDANHDGVIDRCCSALPPHCTVLPYTTVCGRSAFIVCVLLPCTALYCVCGAAKH